MKTPPVALILLALSNGLFAADTATVPPCCAPAVPPTAGVSLPPCCATPSPAALAPLTARSLYQLDATWINDAGAEVKLASLRGRPVVVAMFFASCEYACPVLTSDMQRLRALLPEAIRAQAQFVLVSFDTAHDTPAALQAYRARAGLGADGWTLLRGNATAVQELAMLLGVQYKQDGRGQFAHSNLIAILDRQGEIVHRHAGLMGDVSGAAQATVLAAK